MKHAELERLQRDLDVIKSTLGSEFPYDRWHLLMSLLAGGAGVIVALTSVESLQGLMRNVLLVYFLGIMGFGAWHWNTVRSARARRPGAWNWTRREAIATLIGCLLLASYVVTMRVVLTQRGEWDGLGWREHIAGPVLFFAGVTLLSAGATSNVRLSWVGWGLPSAVGGFLILWCESVAQTRLVLGVTLIIGGLASAAILYHQLRSQAATDVAN